MNVATFRKKLNFALADKEIYVVVDGKRYDLVDIGEHEDGSIELALAAGPAKAKPEEKSVYIDM